MLEILFENEDLVAINKPHGLAVHRSKLVANTDEFALQILRDQLGQKVNPLHRLDRKTAGVLLFSKNNQSTSQLQSALTNAQKTYHAIVRGYAPAEGVIEKPLINDDEVEQEAKTSFVKLAQTEVPIAHGKFLTSRYSFLEVQPHTGRMHQIRKHLNHLRHPIIGDRPHGCNKQNKLFLEQFNMGTMLLHSTKLIIEVNGNQETITAPFHEEFKRMNTALKFDQDLVNL